MPKRRKCKLKNLPTRQCKKPKLSLSLREKKSINYNDDKYAALEYLGDSDNDLIEISSEDSKEKQRCHDNANDSDSGSSSDVVIVGSSSDGPMITFEDVNPISGKSPKNRKKSMEVPIEEARIDGATTRDVEEPAGNCATNAVSVSSSDSVSVSSGSSAIEPRRTRSSSRAASVARSAVGTVSSGGERSRDAADAPCRAQEEIFYVERILDMKVVDGKRLFHLKWEGFPDSENTWEPEENIEKHAMVEEFLNMTQKSKEKLNNRNQEINSESNECNQITLDLDQMNEDSVNIDDPNKSIGTNSTLEDSCVTLNQTVCENTVIELDEALTLEKDSNKNENGPEEHKIIEESNNDQIAKPDVGKKHFEDVSNNSAKEVIIINDDPEENSIDEIVTSEENSVKKCNDNVEEIIENDNQEVIEPVDRNEDLPEKSDLPNDTQEENVNTESLNEKQNNNQSTPAAPITSKKSKKKKSRKKSKKKSQINGTADTNDSEKNNDENQSSNFELKKIKVKPLKDLDGSTDNNKADPNDEEHTNHHSIPEDQESESNSTKKVSSIDHNAYFPKNLPQTVQEIFMVEKILKMKVVNGVRKFYLKWEGFPDSENTWEPEENLECPELIREFLREQKKSKKAKKRKRSVSGNSLILEELPEEVTIKEPVVKARGFPRSREAESILAAGIINDQLMFLIKWKNIDMANLVSARRAYIECPQVVIRFYENHLMWKNSDNSLTLTPKESVTSIAEESVKVNQAISRKKSSLTETMDCLISMVSGGSQDDQQKNRISQNLEREKSNYLHPNSLLNLKPKMKPKTNTVFSKLSLPNTKNKPRPISKTIQRNIDRKMNMGINLNRSFTGSSSNSVLNLINKFKDRKFDVLPKPSVPDIPIHIEPQNNVLEKLITREYDSRDIPKEPSPPKIELPKPNLGPILRPINSYRPDFNPRKFGPANRPTLNPPSYNKSQVVMPSLKSGVVMPRLTAAPSIENKQLKTPLTSQMTNYNSTPTNNYVLIDNSLLGNQSISNSVNSQQNNVETIVLDNFVQQPDSFKNHPQMSPSPINNQPQDRHSTMIKTYLNDQTLNNQMQSINKGFTNSLQQMRSMTASIDPQHLTNNHNNNNMINRNSLNQTEPINNYVQNFNNSQNPINNRASKRMQLAAALQNRYQQNPMIALHPNVIPQTNMNNQVVVYQNSAPQSIPQFQYVINSQPYNTNQVIHHQQQQPQPQPQQTFYTQQPIPQLDPNTRYILPKMDNFTTQGDRNPHLLQPSQIQYQNINQPNSDLLQNSYLNLRAFL